MAKSSAEESGRVRLEDRVRFDRRRDVATVLASPPTLTSLLESSRSLGFPVLGKGQADSEQLERPALQFLRSREPVEWLASRPDFQHCLACRSRPVFSPLRAVLRLSDAELPRGQRRTPSSPLGIEVVDRAKNVLQQFSASAKKGLRRRLGRQELIGPPRLQRTNRNAAMGRRTPAWADDALRCPPLNQQTHPPMRPELQVPD